MRQRFRFRPAVEALEDRWVPATIKYYPGLLQVSNQVGPLRINQVAANSFTVNDNLTGTGPFSSVGKILVTGTNAANVVTLNLGALNYTGSFVANVGNGNDTVNVRGTGGRLGGDVTILTGLGNDAVNIARAGSGLTIGGNVTIADQLSGNDTAAFGNAAGVLRVGGNVSLTAFNAILLNSEQPHVFAKNFTAVLGADTNVTQLAPTPNLGLYLFQEYAAGGLPATKTLTIGGNLTATGGVHDDEVDTGLMTIGGNMSVNLMGSLSSFGNDLFIADHMSGITTIDGSLYYSGGSGVDFLDLAAAVIHGNATINLGTSVDLGQGPDAVAMDTTYSQLVIDGNVTITCEGPLDMIPFAPIQAAIGGNISFYLGNGDSNIQFGTTGTIGGKLLIRAGNGTNFLGLYGATLYDLDVIFGSGDDTIQVNNAGASVTGYANGDGGTNTFDLVAGTLLPTLVLVGF